MTIAKNVQYNVCIKYKRTLTSQQLYWSILLFYYWFHYFLGFRFVCLNLEFFFRVLFFRMYVFYVSNHIDLKEHVHVHILHFLFYYHILAVLNLCILFGIVSTLALFHSQYFLLVHNVML